VCSLGMVAQLLVAMHKFRAEENEDGHDQISTSRINAGGRGDLRTIVAGYFWHFTINESGTKESRPRLQG